MSDASNPIPVCGPCADGMCVNHETDCAFRGHIPCACPNATDAEAAVPTATRPQPQDHKPKNKQRAQVEGEGAETVTFQWDGETWSINPSNAQSMEFFAASEDADADEDPLALVRALRILLGRAQADRLFKGRDVPQIHDFFDRASDEVGSGNR